MIATWRWVCTGEKLGAPSPAPVPPRTSIRFFLFSRDDLGTGGPGTAVSRALADRVPLYRYVAIPETLATVDNVHPKRSLARADRSNFWRWLFTGETLPRTDAGPAGGTPSHPKES